MRAVSMTKAICFSWCSLPSHPGWARMLQTCRAWGWENEPHIAPWIGEMEYVAQFVGRFDKWRSEGYTHALNLDAFDMVCVGPPDELKLKLEYAGNPAVLMSAEVGCWPGDFRRADYGTPGHPFWFAHSPMTVDLTKRPEAILNKLTDRGYGSVQMFLADLAIDREPGVAIDRAQSVVMSAAHCHPWQAVFSIEDGRVFNKLTRHSGLFLHGNGGTPLDWCPIKQGAK